jgi:hypothetical protein
MESKMLVPACALVLIAACGSSTSGTGTGGSAGGTTGSSGTTTSSGATTSGATTSSGTTTSSSGTTGSTSTSSSSSGAGGAGCAQTPTFTDVLAGPLSSCAGVEPPCHNIGVEGLTIKPADAAFTWGQLVNVPTMTAGAGKRVVPDHPEKSFVYRKLTDDLTPTEGSPMPESEGVLPGDAGSGWHELPADQIEMVRCWILGGAEDN